MLTLMKCDLQTAVARWIRQDGMTSVQSGVSWGAYGKLPLLFSVDRNVAPTLKLQVNRNASLLVSHTDTHIFLCLTVGSYEWLDTFTPLSIKQLKQIILDVHCPLLGINPGSTSRTFYRCMLVYNLFLLHLK